MIDPGTKDANVNVTLAELRKIKPNPRTDRNDGSDWKYIAHADVVNVILHHLGACETRIALSNDCIEMAAAFRQRHHGLGHQFHTWVGITWSNSGRYRSYLYVARVNSLTGSIFPVAKAALPKHTIHLNIDRVIPFTLSSIYPINPSMQHKIVNASNHELTLEEGRKILFAAARKRALPWGQIGLIDKKFHETDRSVWSLCCLYSLEVRKNSPILQLPRLFKFLEVLEEYVPLLDPPKPEEILA